MYRTRFSFCLKGFEPEGGNALRKRASGAFLAFRPTELAREGLSARRRRARESPLLRHDDCTGPSNGARFVLERALLGVECGDGVGAFLDDCIDTIGFFALSGRRLIVVD